MDQQHTIAFIRYKFIGCFWSIRVISFYHFLNPSLNLIIATETSVKNPAIVTRIAEKAASSPSKGPLLKHPCISGKSDTRKV